MTCGVGSRTLQMPRDAVIREEDRDEEQRENRLFRVTNGAMRSRKGRGGGVTSPFRPADRDGESFAGRERSRRLERPVGQTAGSPPVFTLPPPVYRRLL
jgi:hypothetical protein